jgi:hypothetical protein
MSGISKYINENNTYVKVILTAGLLIGAISTIANIINNYPNWIKPKIVIQELNLANGFCKMIINGKQRELIGDSTISAGGDWGVKFGLKPVQYADAEDEYETVELVKNGMVYEILAKKVA